MSPKTHTPDAHLHMQRDDFEIFRQKGAYAGESALHHHDFYEISYFRTGNIQYNIESRGYPLTPGDVLLISPMELHQSMPDMDSPGYERIVLWINKQFLAQLCLPGQDLRACFDTKVPGYTNLLRPDATGRQLLIYLLEQLLAETASQEYCHEIYAMSCLVQVLVLINRQALLENRKVEAKTTADSAVYSILGYINEHYREDLSLDFLANKFFISKYHLSREFGRLIGTSVYRYIIQKRLVMAKQMMSEGIPSTLVYQHCGFGDYSSFYRAFKSEYQISPKEFTSRLKQTSTRNEELARKIWDWKEK